MNRSSSRKDLRAERMGLTPYSRKSTPLKESTSWNPLASLRSFVSQSFNRRRDDEAISVSGSEEEWDGTVPDSMRGQDVFSLAAAAGRGGNDFDQRAQTWRANKPKVTGSKALTSSKSNWGLLGLAESSEAGGMRPSPSMPALRSIAQQAPQSTPPKARLAPSNYGTPQASGSSVLLRRFMEDKGVKFDPEDADVLEGLARSLRAESGRPIGGWSAAIGTPSRATSVISDRFAPSPSTTRTNATFSLGSSAALAPSSTPHRRKITYLGPGMSARRLNRDLKPARKPAFESFDTVKKRRVEGDEPMETDTQEKCVYNSALSAASSMAAAFNAKVRGKTSATLPTTSQETPRDKSKRAGDDLLRDLIDETIGPAPSPSIVINPYEEEAPAASSKKVAALRSSLRQSSSSRNSSLRRSTPVRGAAEKLASVGTSTRKLTTLEMVSGYKKSVPQADPEDDSMATDEVIANPGEALRPAPSVSAPPAPTPEPVATVPPPSAFKSLPVPSLSSSTFGKSTTSPPKSPPMQSEPAESPAVSAILSASKSAPAPTFNPPVIGLGPPPAVNNNLTIPPAIPRKVSSARIDPSAIYLSAKDTALNVDKLALPFFTFTFPSSVEPSKEVKDAALGRPLESYNFIVQTSSLESVPSPAPAGSKTPPSDVNGSTATPAAFAPKAAAEGEWTCDLCMLKNTAADTEQCHVCEAPKPGSKPKAATAVALPAPPAAPTAAFSFGKKPAAEGEWECSTCMLKNTAADTEQCHVCEAPKPGSKPKSAAAAAPPAPPAAPAAPFSFGKKPAAEGEWECSTCMLKNTAADTEQCHVCEAPKPGAKPKAAGPPATMPAPPSGGFSFGGKTVGPPAPPSGGFSFGAKPAGTPAPPSGGFTFGGATGGPPAPPAAGGFTFGGKPVSSSSNPTPAPALPGLPTPPSGGFTFGQSSAPAGPAPLRKATGAAGEWTCSVCGLANEATATKECSICESPR